jgi:D-alanyl-D-alanine carboxypeptidase/D-alanyl-D-alanine-endopeptidase (penicillin-binding protein 4)
VHPASVTKIATTIALLDLLGPAHRFVTTFEADGPVADDTLAGNLFVEAQGDPFFVYESAFLALAELRALGVRRVAGDLRVHGPLLFNWQPDDAGTRLRAALSGRDGAQAWTAVQGRSSATAALTLQAAGLRFEPAQPAPGAERRRLVAYRSPPLLAIMKELNSFSNNVFHPLSSAIGGPKEVERIVRERIGRAARGELAIDNAAGAGLTNRMSPRVAAGVVRALIAEAAEHSLALSDLLPVAGIDRGTLRDRFTDLASHAMVVAKTGTYGEIGISALAGAVHTRRHGVVVFAILNRGLDVSRAKARQDAFVRALIEDAGGIPIAYGGAPDSPLLDASAELIH